MYLGRKIVHIQIEIDANFEPGAKRLAQLLTAPRHPDHPKQTCLKRALDPAP